MIENLFHYLWWKDELDSGPEINIPDTIIYKFRQPAFWYFTGKDGKIKKKRKFNISNIKIEEAFASKELGSDIVAYYLFSDPETQKTTIEYLNKSSLRHFLYEREKVDNGVLQRFVEPKGIKNVMIRGIWSPKLVLVERRENLHHLSDQKYSLYERAVTYEGPEKLSVASPIRGSVIPVSIKQTCHAVVDHVGELSFGKNKISRLALNFKLDGHNKLWLLWASSLRLENTTVTHVSSGDQQAVIRTSAPSPLGPVSLETNCQVPGYVNAAFRTTQASRAVGSRIPINDISSLSVVHDKDIIPVSMCECRSCKKQVLEDRFYQMSYKTLVAHFEQVMSVLAASTNGSMVLEWPPDPKTIQALGGVGLAPLENLRKSIRNTKDKSKFVIPPEDIEIPPVIREAHPHLTAHDYRRFRKDPLFLYKNVPVCEDCYLVLAEIQNESCIQPLKVAAGRDTVADRERREDKSSRALQDHIERASKPRIEKRERRMKEKMQHLKKHQIESHESIRKLQGPKLPPRIDDQNIKTIQITRSLPELKYANSVDVAEKQKQEEEYEYDPDEFPGEFRQELQDRENAFFRDLYKNPNLQHGHPLSHIVATHAKLSMSQEGLGSKQPPKSKLSQKSVAFLSPVMSKRDLEVLDFNSPYAKSQVKLSLIPAMQQKSVKHSAAYDFNEVSDEAENHRQFLISTLQHVKSQLSNTVALEQSVKIEMAAEEAKESINQGGNLNKAWGTRQDALTMIPADHGVILRKSIRVAEQLIMASVDIQEDEMVISLFNPKLAQSQHIKVSMDAVLLNAPTNAGSSEELAEYIVDTLVQDKTEAELFPDVLNLKVPFVI